LKFKRNKMMMKNIFSAVTLLLTTLSLHAQSKVDVAKEMKFAAAQYELMLNSHQDITLFPQSTKEDGKPDNRTSDWWCSGFFGGSLWYLYEYTKADKWKEAADKWTMAVE